MNNNKNIITINKIFLLVVLFTFSFIATVFSVGILNNNVVYADAATCQASGGTWAYSGSQLTCICPADFQLEGDRCTSTSQVCDNSGGTMSYVGSELRCVCPANLQTSITGNSCQSISGTGSDTGSFSDQPIETDCEPPNGEALSRTNCGIINLIVVGINFLSAIAGIVIIASLMIAGFIYMTAQDDPGKVQKAKSRIVMTLVALTVFIFMYALLNFLVPGGVL